MGNFSRNTFELNKNKNYVGVRLQQGVPLVDADWNELDDAIRNEIYSGLSHAFPDGARPGSDLEIEHIKITPLPPNDLTMKDGVALVGGRPLRIPTTVRYSTQPWFDNPTRAAQDGVTVIPPLTTPSANRADIVYLDVWEREVRSTEDGNLVHPTIGVETCVRLKREFAFRVAEGTQTLPVTPAGHLFMPLALLHRLAGQANITIEQIEDIRPQLFSTRGTRAISFVPVFLPFGNTGNPWVFDSNIAKLNSNGPSVFLPLGLPDGASLLRLEGEATTKELYFLIVRKPPAKLQDPQLLNRALNVGGGGGAPPSHKFSFEITDTDRVNIVDNSRYSYYLSIGTGINSTPSSISQLPIIYRY